MVELYTNSTPLETFSLRYEEVTNSSADFDKNIRGLLSHFFDGLVSDTVLQWIAELAKKQDLNRHPAQGGFNDHRNDPDCMQRTHAVLMSLHPEILEQLKTFQAQLALNSKL